MRSFRSHPSALFEVRQYVRERTTESDLPEQAANDLVVAVSEACANSMLHSNSARISVTWEIVGGCVEVCVADEGVFQRQVLFPEVGVKSGHGIPLMMALVDGFSIREGTPRKPGTVVRLRKCGTG
jgi:anti-sigma regulatory factor (Ser/Thr protein kinase)